MSSDQQLEVETFDARPHVGMKPDVAAELTKYPPGLVAVLTKETGSYGDFISAYRRLLLPAQSREGRFSSGEKVVARNAAVAECLPHADLDWVFFLDDDHKFDSDVLLRLLKRFYAEDFDLLGPVYLARLAPPMTYPIGGIFLREGREIRVRNLEWADMPGLSPVLERRDLCLGTSGLLIRRRVFAALDAPYFQVGQIHPAKEHEDIYFSVRCQEAGLKVGLDCTVVLGHTARATLWPNRQPDGSWSVGMEMDQPLTPPNRSRWHAAPPQNGGRIIQP